MNNNETDIQSAKAFIEEPVKRNLKDDKKREDVIPQEYSLYKNHNIDSILTKRIKKIGVLGNIYL